MTVTLPDEILSKIVGACIGSRWNLKITLSDHRDTNDDNTKRYTLDGMPNVNNIKLVNKLFHAEIWTAIRATFTGELNITDDGDAILALLTINTPLTSWLLPRVATLVISDTPSNTDSALRNLEHLIISSLPSLQKLSFRVDESECAKLYLGMNNPINNSFFDAIITNRVQRLSNYSRLSEGVRAFLGRRSVLVELRHGIHMKTLDHEDRALECIIHVNGYDGLEIVDRKVTCPR